MIAKQKTRGLIAAPFTPLRGDSTVHLEAIDVYARWLQEQGVAGAFICGTTGEGMSLTTGERQQIAERWMSAAPAGMRIMVHVGHHSLADCRILAAHAASVSADSFACMSPFFFRPDSAESLVQWCEQVASAAPELPFYYYHIPSITGVHCKVSDFLAIAADRIPNLAGIKYTFEDLEDYERCLKFHDGRLEILFGRDEMLLSALALGARGAVGSTYNFAAPLYQAVIAAHERGDVQRAAELQAVAAAMTTALGDSGVQLIAAFKWLMGRVAVDCGPPRLPLRQPTAEQAAALEARLQQTGIFEWLPHKPSGISATT